MQTLTFPPRQSLGLYPTPLQHLDTISARYGRDIWIKRDDLCGVALGGNKVRKLEFLLAQAKAQGCDTVITTGGAQSNHAMLTAACAARLGMQAILVLKKRGVTEHLGNQVLDDLYGARVRFVDTDSYDDIHAQAQQLSLDLEAQGHRAFWIPLGGSTPLGTLGYVEGVRELAEQAQALGYKTVFWSLAYVDWNTDDQPSAEEAYAKLLPRIHDGAIVLLHSTSATNAAILDDLLTKWEEMGYTFASLDQLPGLA